VTNTPTQLTPIMLDRITYGTFLVFGSACCIMVIYAILCVPETKGTNTSFPQHVQTNSHQDLKLETNTSLLPGVPLESIHLLFAGNIVAGATRDTVPRYSRAKHLSQGGSDEHYEDDDDDLATGKNGSMSSHVERLGDSKAKNAAYGMNNAGTA
jgi:SP family sugar:H+ symporter-like MFS transporter